MGFVTPSQSMIAEMDQVIAQQEHEVVRELNQIDGVLSQRRKRKPSSRSHSANARQNLFEGSTLNNNSDLHFSVDITNGTLHRSTSSTGTRRSCFTDTTYRHSPLADVNPSWKVLQVGLQAPSAEQRVAMPTPPHSVPHCMQARRSTDLRSHRHGEHSPTSTQQQWSPSTTTSSSGVHKYNKRGSGSVWSTAATTADTTTTTHRHHQHQQHQHPQHPQLQHQQRGRGTHPATPSESKPDLIELAGLLSSSGSTAAEGDTSVYPTVAADNVDLNVTQQLLLQANEISKVLQTLKSGQQRQQEEGDHQDNDGRRESQQSITAFHEKLFQQTQQLNEQLKLHYHLLAKRHAAQFVPQQHNTPTFSPTTTTSTTTTPQLYFTPHNNSRSTSSSPLTHTYRGGSGSTSGGVVGGYFHHNRAHPNSSSPTFSSSSFASTSSIFPISNSPAPRYPTPPPQPTLPSPAMLPSGDIATATQLMQLNEIKEKQLQLQTQLLGLVGQHIQQQQQHRTAHTDSVTGGPHNAKQGTSITPENFSEMVNNNHSLNAHQQHPHGGGKVSAISFNLPKPVSSSRHHKPPESTGTSHHHSSLSPSIQSRHPNSGHTRSSSTTTPPRMNNSPPRIAFSITREGVITPVNHPPPTTTSQTVTATSAGAPRSPRPTKSPPHSPHHGRNTPSPHPNGATTQHKWNSSGDHNHRTHTTKGDDLAALTAPTAQRRPSPAKRKTTGGTHHGCTPHAPHSVTAPTTASLLRSRQTAHMHKHNKRPHTSHSHTTIAPSTVQQQHPHQQHRGGASSISPSPCTTTTTTTASTPTSRPTTSTAEPTTDLITPTPGSATVVDNPSNTKPSAEVGDDSKHSESSCNHMPQQPPTLDTQNELQNASSGTQPPSISGGEQVTGSESKPQEAAPPAGPPPAHLTALLSKPEEENSFDIDPEIELSSPSDSDDLSDCLALDSSAELSP